MSRAHQQSILPIQDMIQTADDNTAELWHFDISPNGVNGTKPVDDIYDDSLICWLEMQNQNSTGTYVIDKSRYGNHGKINGATLVNGINGKSLNFDGSSDTLTINPFEAGTIWTVNISMKYVYQSKTFEFFLGTLDGSGNYGKILLAHSGYISFSYPANTYVNFSVASTEINNVNSTLTFVSNGTTVALYVNGVLRDTQTPTGTYLKISAIGNAWSDSTWMAKGDIHSLRVFNRALSADEVAGLCNQSIYSLRVDGKYGSAIALEDATTNVITNPLFNGPTGWAFSSDTAGSFSTADGWGKITKGTGTYDFLRQTLSLTGTYTGKITFKNDTIGQVGLRFSTGGGGQNITLTGTNDPIIVETTITASGTAYFDIILGSYYGQTSPASQVSFSYAQCEQKACSTSFVNGSRVRGLVNYPNPLQGLTQGTVSCWAKKSPLNMEGGALLAIDNNVDATSSLTIDFYASYMRFFIYDDAGNSYVVTVYTATDNNWHMYAFTFDGSKIIGYIDGITYGPTPYATVFTSKGTLKLCQRGNPTYSDRYGNFLIDELRIDKVARTADEIKAWHLSNAPYFPRGKERAVL